MHKYIIARVPITNKVRHVIKVFLKGDQTVSDFIQLQSGDGLEYRKVLESLFKQAYPCPDLFIMDDDGNLFPNPECPDDVVIPSHLALSVETAVPDHVEVKDEKGKILTARKTLKEV